MRSRLLKEIQRLRGKIYLEDGAIERSQLTPDGRHESPSDHLGWHLLVLDEKNRVQGGARYVHRPADITLNDFDLKRSALASSWAWGDKLHTAVEQERIVAQKRGFHYAEVGGWALSKEIRCTPEAIRTALGLFALSRLLGGSIGITTATIRNQSASILQRIGGTAINVNDVPLPSYYDPQYKCVMTILRFDSSMPHPRYETKIERIRHDLNRAVVMCLRKSAHIEDLSRLASSVAEYDQTRI
jgi:hypothetical protein